MQWQMEPLPHWTYPETTRRARSPFTAGWSDTLALLDRELRMLGVRGTVAIRVCASESDIRRDGMLRASAKPWHPGVALSFQSKHGPLTYPCDTYDRSPDMPGWQANMRAIALSLEALRAVDRHGVAGKGEQYAGWRQITSGAADVTAAYPSADAALRFLRDLTGLPDAPVSAVVRAARSHTHPDRNNGDRTMWDRVENAAALLRRSERRSKGSAPGDC